MKVETLGQEKAKPVSSSSSGGPPGPAPVESDVLTADAMTRVARLARDATAVLAAFSNHDPRWSPRKHHLVFRSNRSGRSQAYLSGWNELTLPPVRLMDTQESVLFAGFANDDSRVLLLLESPTGNSSTLVHVNLEGTDVVTLGPPQSHRLGLPHLARGVPGTLLYTARHPSKPWTKLFAQKTNGTPARMVAQVPSSCRLLDVSTHAKRALLGCKKGGELLEIDVRGGTITEIRLGEQGWLDAIYDSKRGYVIVATRDQDGNAKLHPHGKNPPKRSRSFTISADDPLVGLRLLMSPRSDLLIAELSTFRGTILHLLNPRTWKTRSTIQPNLGVGRVAEFSQKGGVITFAWESADSPADLYEFNPSWGRLRKLRRDVRPTLAMLDDVAIQTVGIPRGADPPVPASAAGAPTDGKVLPAVVLLPKSRKKAPSLPWATVVLLQDRLDPPAWSEEARFLAASGFAVVVTKAAQPAIGAQGCSNIVGDLSAVATWLSEQSWSDKERLALFGVDRQSFVVVSALSAHPATWRAAVAMVGANRQPEGSAPPCEFDSPNGPVFIFQGGRDTHSPRPLSDRWVRNLRARSAPVEYLVADWTTQNPSLAARSWALARAARFLEAHLRNTP